MPFIVIFIVIPFVELMIFASVSEHIGLFTALSLALLTAIIGGTLVKRQGLQTILAMREAANIGKIPLSEIFDGFCLVAAGALLITPGFLTDFIGFLLLVPKMRDIMRHMIKEHTSWVFHAESHTRRPKDQNIIEGEFEELD